MTFATAITSLAQRVAAEFNTLRSSLATVATTGAYADLSGKPTLGTAAAAATGDFATAAQGALADSAQQPPTEGAFVNGDKTKLDGIEAGADVTDTANVTAAGALMDSEVTNLAQVKAFNSADYATVAQGTLADSAVQPGDLATVATSGVYADLSGKPTLGTAAAADTTDFASAAFQDDFVALGPPNLLAGTTNLVSENDTQTLSNKTLLDCLETVYTITDGASVDIDPVNGSIQNWTLGANRTPTESLASGQIVLLRIADGTARTITWPTTTWVGGSAPTLAETGWTLVLLWKDGSTLYGKHVGDVA